MKPHATTAPPPRRDTTREIVLQSGTKLGSRAGYLCWAAHERVVLAWDAWSLVDGEPQMTRRDHAARSSQVDRRGRHPPRRTARRTGKPPGADDTSCSHRNDNDQDALVPHRPNATRLGMVPPASHGLQVSRTLGLPGRCGNRLETSGGERWRNRPRAGGAKPPRRAETMTCGEAWRRFPRTLGAGGREFKSRRPDSQNRVNHVIAGMLPTSAGGE